jgi:transcriptional regulator with XRE-family HTH domain
METTTAQALESRRQELGLSFTAVERRVYDMLGSYAPRMETIRAYHRDASTPKRPDLIVLAAICDVYDIALKDVAPEAYAELNSVRDLLFHQSGWLRGSPDQPHLPGIDDVIDLRDSVIDHRNDFGSVGSQFAMSHTTY